MSARPAPRRPVAWARWVAGLFALAAVAGCGRPPATGDAAARRVAQRGPLKLDVVVTPPSPRVGDLIRVAVEFLAPDDYDVQLPEAGAFGDLGAKLVEAPEPRPAESGRVWRREFTIAPGESGKVEIPALSVRYDPRAPVDPNLDGPPATQPTLTQELASEPITLDIGSVLTDEDDPSKPRDITGALSPEAPPLSWRDRLLIAGAAAAVVAGAIAAYAYIRARGRRPLPAPSPEAWALQRIDELARQDWFADGRVSARYYDLTEIVREYIERQFELAAPEMTTEEFLVHATRDRRAALLQPARLRSFLEACDIVKYAAFHPRPEEALIAIESARAYVSESAAARRAAAPPADARQSDPVNSGQVSNVKQ